MADTISPDQRESCRSINVNVISNSVHQYMNYSKQMQIRLAEINDNVSNVIKESCTGIDNICNRVRQCLFEMDQREITTCFHEEVTEYEIIEEESKSSEELSEENEVINKPSTEDMSQQCKLPPVENLQTITPFFTVINCQGDEHSSRPECCRKSVMTKTIYSLMDKKNSDSNLKEDSEIGIDLDHFKETVSTLCENFDVMNKLVENIHKEIEQFSQTALTSRKPSSQALNKKYEDTNTRKLKPIKRLSKSNSRQKSIQVGDCLSENEIDLEMMEWNRDAESFVIPDVYRKRAFTDLYQRLLDQVEANDSLIFFQTLMQRQHKMEKKSNKNGISQSRVDIPILNYSIPKKSLTNSLSQKRSSKKLDLEKKYVGSLWFTQRTMAKEKNSSKNISRKGSRKNSSTKKIDKMIENKTRYLYAPPDLAKIQNKRTRMSDSVKNLSKTKKINTIDSTANVTRQSCSLECTCKMIVQNDLPPSPSTKCHLQWLREKPPSGKIKFLDILDDLTARDLLPLQSEYPRRDQQQPRQLDYKDIQDTYLYKMLYGKQSSKNTWKQLLEPSLQCTRKNFNTNKTSRTISKKVKEEKPREKPCESFMEKFCTQNFSRSEIIKKLSPYMFDPDKQDEACCVQSLIVMPVRVYYDNFKPNEPPTKLKTTNKQPIGTPKRISVPPSKESKLLRKMEVTPSGSPKPMKVVFDTITNKPQAITTPTAAKPTPVMAKVPASSARLNSEKNQAKDVRSRSFSPKRFASYCREASILKKEPTDLKQLQENKPLRAENVPMQSKIQAEFNKIRRDIYNTKFTQQDKKLWASKYGKTVGQQLVSYIQHQEPETRVQSRYAIPKLRMQNILPEKKNIAGFLKEVNPHRQILSHVRNMQTKPDVIQDNIKKAIDVIEQQMVDILNNGSNSVEAFDIMEKEIMSVLSLMKCNGSNVLKTIPSKVSTPKDKTESHVDINALENDYNIISDQLFDRLQKILDGGMSSVPTTPSEGYNKRNCQPKKEKEETRKKQKLSTSKRNKIGIFSSSTSASMDEKMHDKRSPRPNVKKTEKNEFKSKSVNLGEPSGKEKWERVCGDQIESKTVHIESIDQILTRTTHIESENSASENDIKPPLENEAWNNKDISNLDTDPFYDIETDNTFDATDDNKAEKLFTTDENLETLNEISLSVKETAMELSIIDTELRDELNAIENVQIQKEVFIEEIENTMKEPETLTVTPDSDLDRHISSTELQELLNEELDQAITKAETAIVKNQLNKELKELITQELDKAIKQIETRTVQPNNLEITDAYRIVISTEINKVINEELDKALNRAETMVDITSYETTDISRHMIISEMKEFINEELNKALINSEYTEVYTDEPIINSEIREFISEELNKTINKVEELTMVCNPTANIESSKSVTTKDIKELINDELNRTIQKAEDLAKFPDTVALDTEEGENVDLSISECEIEEPGKKLDLSISSITSEEGICVPKMEVKELKTLGTPEKEISPRVNAILETQETTSPYFADHIHKIIKRVEDIYSQLEDIQESDSLEKIPVFKEVDIPDVHSEMFLTPFMQAVKETRQKSDNDKETIIDKSPSYYNVMNFLDTLNNIQKEVPYEIHVARLYNYAHVYQEALIYYLTDIWHDIKFTKSCIERSSCLKSVSEERKCLKQKKVSFSQIPKEDKSSQATLCPFHKMKAIKISSQQFPPLPAPNEEARTSDENPEIIEIKKASGCMNNSDASENICISRYRCLLHKNHSPNHSESTKVACKIHGNVEKPPHVCKKNRKHCERHRKYEDCCEQTENRQVSGDKSTQVFCQMQKENPIPSTSGDQPCQTSSNNEESTECKKHMEANPDDSKSTDKDFLDNSQIDPFYDYLNDNVNAQEVVQKAKDVQEQNTTKAQPKIAVFKQVVEEQSTQPEEPMDSKEIETYKKKLEKRREVRLMRKSSLEIVRQSVPKNNDSNDNVILLKSFYAIVYILMFTALSLDYRCI